MAGAIVLAMIAGIAVMLGVGAAEGEPTPTPRPTPTPTPPTVILTANPPSPQPVGTRIALTMSASGGPFSHWYWTLSDNGSVLAGQPPNPFAFPPPRFTWEWAPTVAGEHHLVATLSYQCPTIPVCPPASAKLIYTITEPTPSPTPTPTPTPSPSPHPPLIADLLPPSPLC